MSFMLSPSIVTHPARIHESLNLQVKRFLWSVAECKGIQRGTLKRKIENCSIENQR